MRLLVRTWNLFHGNASPPRRRAFLEEMVRLATADRPDLLCLQELPLWSLPKLEPWSKMQSVPDVTRHAPLGVGLGRAVTALNHGLVRSALTGQANAILVARSMRIREHRSVALNRVGEPRRCQVVRLEREGRTLAVGNVHADSRSADSELVSAARFVRTFAGAGEPFVLAGDFNVAFAESHALPALAEEGLSGATPTGIDHILSLGLEGPPGEPWRVSRRTVDGVVLSDHPPVERELR